ncbi:2,3-diketo-L-gulonate TRAP transporter small permease protein YiaM [Marinomonas spartinae]|uniref:TRAP transporter small permease protein n=1 Tax=Marinomonas spartinae TaxID=1792290 RepID=A0A1A8T5P3_9GAMM|nr:TRAP transporter small permease [Marinomonas spartinae]SBS27694.1 2,3-diketo-L-gulonate TRAP transporter small permease protein YiaM [Marinomonas spartinae]SBS30105.1 2,3-diketo-L-gulonate TRAP transporter small permease protein YiaM [Marinomonas spartinae]
MTASIRASFVKRFLDALAFLAMTISGLCMIVLVMSFGLLVYGRYVLNNTPTWVEQMAMLLIITITFLGAAVGIHERTHLSVDMVSLLLPEKVNRVIDILIDTSLAGFGAAMLYYCHELMTFGWYRLIPLLGIPDGLRYAPVMVAGGLIFVFSLYRILVGIQKLFAKQSVVANGGQ